MRGSSDFADAGIVKAILTNAGIVKAIPQKTEGNMNKQELIQKAKNGDQQAFCSLYGIYKDRLYRYAFYRLRHPGDAEDAVSECVLSAWRQIGSLRDAKAFAGWIFRILSACCNKLIKQQIDRRGEISLDDYRESPASDSAEIERSMILQEALGKLSDDERNIVLLSVVSGLTSKEIAEITGMTAGSVRSNLSRSLSKLRGYLE